jgi:hypothetical protein
MLHRRRQQQTLQREQIEPAAACAIRLLHQLLLLLV